MRPSIAAAPFTYPTAKGADTVGLPASIVAMADHSSTGKGWAPAVRPYSRFHAYSTLARIMLAMPVILASDDDAPVTLAPVMLIRPATKGQPARTMAPASIVQACAKGDGDARSALASLLPVCWKLPAAVSEQYRTEDGGDARPMLSTIAGNAVADAAPLARHYRGEADTVAIVASIQAWAIRRSIHASGVCKPASILLDHKRQPRASVQPAPAKPADKPASDKPARSGKGRTVGAGTAHKVTLPA